MTELSSCAGNFFNEICGVNVIANPGQEVGLDDDCILVLGQIHPDGTAAPGVYQYNSRTANDQFGANGTLMSMINEILDSCPTADLYVYGVADPAGTAGSAEIEIAGVDTATASGTVYVWINGQAYSVPFDPAASPTPDTDAIVAARLAAVIASANPFLDVTVAAGVVSIETTETGEVAGWLDVRSSYSCQPSLITSDEITVTIAATEGVGVPDLSGLPGIPEGCEFVVNPFTDNASISSVESYLCREWSGGASSRAYGVYYGSAVDAAAFGLSTNDPKFSYLAINGALTPPYTESAAYACIAYSRLNCAATDKASSLSGEVMPALLSPESGDLFTNSEKANLVENGMGYFNVTRAKDVVIGRAVTTYTVADNGTTDLSLQDVNKPAIYACMSKRLTDGLTAKFTGFTFRTDGVVGGNSRRVTTVEGVENCIITFAQEFSDENIIQNIDAFIDSLNVELDATTGCILVQTNPDIPCPLCCMNVYLGAS